ncbi:MAG: hypothetical protein GYA17_16290 [Chloroflexi bacterium]|nr:hypothetical protein [Anaerolineaceae bacterium]NMB89918.1 hypothetical protein [Chloroflexota bacterium]
MNLSESRSSSPIKALGNLRAQPGMIFAIIIISALLAFEVFNYSTTDYALRDLLGDLRFAGIRWATILSIAFCGIDFAGIARLFTPEQGLDEPKEVWYLFGAWLLAATMNAILTWWGVSMAVVSHTVQSTAVIDTGTLTKIVPVFVSLMVWVIRILIIGSLSLAGERLLWGDVQRPQRSSYNHNRNHTNATTSSLPLGSTIAPRPMPNRSAAPHEASQARSEPRPEPTYHSVAMPRPAPRSTSASDSNASRRL